MVFSSSVFLFGFLPLLLIAYFCPVTTSRNYKNTVLLIFSILFYWWGEPVFVLVMLLSIVLNWGLGLAVSFDRGHTSLYVALAVLYNVGLLVVCKYLNFFSENLAWLTGTRARVFQISLPIGVSFFTFQMMSYVFDVAGRKAKCQKNLLKVALYVTMFPQLIAGPIVRYETVAEEIECRRENREEFSQGVCRFVGGLAKKVLIANNCGILADLVFEGDVGKVPVITAWIAAGAYILQLYYDFSGYSDMAIGLGRMFGFHFLENFRYPYTAASVTELWRRWHISMSTWFRDYVYFPMGGSRVRSRCRMVFNLFVVWILTGLWHGANWTYVLWGLINLFFLLLEKFTGFPKRLGPLSHIYTLLVVLVADVFFRSASVRSALQYLAVMFGLRGNILADAEVFRLCGQYFLFLAAAILFCMPVEKWLFPEKGSGRVRDVCYVTAMAGIFVLSMIYVLKGGYNPFIYFNF